MADRLKLYWVGSVCEHVEPVGDEADYKPGDDEPCVHCPYPRCIATVTEIPVTDRRATRREAAMAEIAAAPKA